MSNNGSQHLAALTKDEVTAVHVNLVPQELPGDLYKFIADHVWPRLDEQFKELPEEEQEVYKSIVVDLLTMKRQIQKTEPKSEARKLLVEQIRDFKTQFGDLLGIAGLAYWLLITDAKDKRKIVKR